MPERVSVTSGKGLTRSDRIGVQLALTLTD
jgi:hypothetical protein